MSLSFPCIWVPGSSFILASCLIGKEAISSVLLDQWLILQDSWSIFLTRDQHLPGLRHSPQFAAAKKTWLALGTRLTGLIVKTPSASCLASSCNTVRSKWAFHSLIAASF